MKPISHILIIFAGLGVAFGVAGTSVGDNFTNLERINFGQGRLTVPGEILVKFKPMTFEGEPTRVNGTVRTSQASINALFGELQVSGMRRVFRTTETPLGNIHRLRFDAPVPLHDALERMATDPNVEWVEPNYLSFTSTTPNDQHYPKQWGLTKIQADLAWGISQGDPNIVIAVIDTGVDYEHPDLEDNIWHNPGEIPDNGQDDDGNHFVDDVIGWDFVSVTEGGHPGEDMGPRDNNPMDFHGHGTHCAGIASATTNNDTGIAGTAWSCQIMALRAGYKDSSGDGTLADSDTAAALEYAANKGAHVINMSWCGDGSRTLREAINYAQNADCILMAAAGNNGRAVPLQYPAAYPGVIAVAASDMDDDRASFSNYGDWVDIAAPGVAIYSTYYDGDAQAHVYSYMRGTSMATPFVAGVSALILSREPTLTANEVMNQLLDSADAIEWTVNSSVVKPTKRLNAYRALNGSPVAYNQSISVNEDTAKVITLQGGPDGDTLIYTVVSGPSNGSLSGTAPELTYTPDPNFNGSDSFTFKVNDGTVDSNTATVEITVNPVNDVPEITSTPVSTATEDVLYTYDVEATDPDEGDVLTYSLTTSPAGMTIDSATGLIQWTPTNDHVGDNDVVVQVVDAAEATDPQPFTITVENVNDPPVADDQPITTDEDTPFAIILTGSDPDGDMLNYTVVSGPANGSLAGVDPNVTYTPDVNFNGNDNFIFKVSDGTADSGTATVSIVVNPVNDPPVVSDIPNVSFTEDGSNSSINLDAYVDDPDNTNVEIAWTHTGNANVNVSIDSTTHVVTFTALSDWSGSETITFAATDPGNLSDSDPMVVTVTPVNDPPIVTNIPDVSFAEDGSNSSIDLDAYVDDPDNIDAEIAWTYTGNANVDVSIEPTARKVNFTVLPNWNGNETITFTATDPGNLSDSDPTTVTVTPVNDRPVVSNIPDVSFVEDGSNSSIDLDAYVTDLDNTDAEISWTYTGNTNVNVSIDSTTHIVAFTANLNWNGSETITFTATDPGNLSDSDPTTVNVTPVNDLPTVSNLTIEPSSPGPADDLRALYTYNDIDGDAEIGTQIKWYKNGVHQLYDDILTLPFSATLPDEEWYFTATPSDGTDLGDTRTSPSVIVGGMIQELRLYPGWNLISIYVNTANVSISSILKPIEGRYRSVWSYNATLQEWERYIPGDPLNTLNSMEPGRGYWIDIADDEQEVILAVVGEQTVNVASSLSQGWHLAGYNSPEPSALFSIECACIWTYDSVNETWLIYIADAPDFLNTLTQLEPGRGYWIYIE